MGSPVLNDSEPYSHHTKHGWTLRTINPLQWSECELPAHKDFWGELVSQQSMQHHLSQLNNIQSRGQYEEHLPTAGLLDGWIANWEPRWIDRLLDAGSQDSWLQDEQPADCWMQDPWTAELSDCLNNGLRDGHMDESAETPPRTNSNETRIKPDCDTEWRIQHSTVLSLRSHTHAEECLFQSRVTGSTGALQEAHTVTAAERDGSNTDPTFTGICCRDLLAYETQMPTATPHSNLARIQIQRRGVESSTSRRSCREANNRQTQQRLPESSATKHKQTKC